MMRCSANPRRALCWFCAVRRYRLALARVAFLILFTLALIALARIASA